MQPLETANRFCHTCPLKFNRDRHRIYRVTGGIQRSNCVIDMSVCRPIELLSADKFNGVRYRVTRKQHCTKQRLFSLKIVGRHPAVMRSAGLSHRHSFVT